MTRQYDYAKTGGQALHLFSGAGAHPEAPKCFKKHKEAAHLFDYNKFRLRQTARRLGVRNIQISRMGERGQHVDLCGRPLIIAKELCDELQQNHIGR